MGCSLLGVHFPTYGLAFSDENAAFDLSAVDKYAVRHVRAPKKQMAYALATLAFVCSFLTACSKLGVDCLTSDSKLGGDYLTPGGR